MFQFTKNAGKEPSWEVPMNGPSTSPHPDELLHIRFARQAGTAAFLETCLTAIYEFLKLCRFFLQRSVGVQRIA